MNPVKAFYVLVLFAMTIGFVFTHNYTSAIGSFFAMFLVLFIGIAIEAGGKGEKENTYNIHPSTSPYNVYYGEELKFTQETISSCLTKHLPYYNCLGVAEQQKFLTRLNRFMKSKTFKIHDSKGFIEMPVLVSAAAIQLSFGFDNYMLPQFEFIHIYPEEFFRSHHSFDVLAGNVSGQSINISWKHFMEGFRIPEDGQNVGLHEMAHAYYYQNFVCRENTDDHFVSGYPQFDVCANKAFDQEQSPGNDLYSDYALKNFQEFWAESIELFFEKPAYLNNSYPDLYLALKSVMRQDPLGNKV